MRNRRAVLKFFGVVAGFFLLPQPLRAKSLSKPAVRINVLRPPGAVMEHRYPGKCIRCGRCAEVCPYRCIKLLDIRQGLHAGTPMVFVENSPCYLCMKCVHVFPSGALQPIEQHETRMGMAVIDHHSCVSWQDSGLLCKTCYNVCSFLDKAIRMIEFRPHVDEKYCTGCGICTHACLVERQQGGKAININPIYSSIRRRRGPDENTGLEWSSSHCPGYGLCIPTYHSSFELSPQLEFLSGLVPEYRDW